MFHDQIKPTLIARLHCLLDEAAHAPNSNNAELVHQIVKEAIRYGGVVREEIAPQVEEVGAQKRRFWQGRS